jgi:hypothetical protein
VLLRRILLPSNICTPPSAALWQRFFVDLDVAAHCPGNVRCRSQPGNPASRVTVSGKHAASRSSRRAPDQAPVSCKSRRPACSDVKSEAHCQKIIYIF